MYRRKILRKLQTCCKEEHKCYQKRDKIINSKRKPFIFFDYECYQKNFKHIPNYVVAKKICVPCLENKSCQCFCQNAEYNNNNDFCEWLFEQEEEMIAICHNFKGNDSSFVMEWILDNMTSLDKAPDVLMNGSKILSLKLRKIKIIDSLSFLPMPLDKYNNSYHRSIKCTPISINSKSDQNKIYQNLYKYRKEDGNKSEIRLLFKKGDKIRVSKSKRTFEKGYTPNYTIEIFTIDKVLPTVPPTYVIKDLQGEEINGTFFEQEIQKISESTEPI
jgi:hypothetical protein